MGCVFYYSGDYSQNNVGYSWIEFKNITDADLGTLYVNSIYWAITTMSSVGYGDIYPQTTSERLTALPLIIMSSGVFSFILNKIGNTVSNYNQVQNLFREKMMYINRLNIKQGMP